MPGLRAITMTARLQLLMSCCRNLSILVLSWELRPFAGLLVKTTVGWSVTVWVYVICRRRLLDNLSGPRLR